MKKRKPNKAHTYYTWIHLPSFLFLHKTSARLPHHLSEKFFLWLASAGIPVKALHGWLFMISVCHNDQYYQSTNHIMVLSLLALLTLCILFRLTWCLEKSYRSEVIQQISLCHLVACLAFQAHNSCRCYVLGHSSLLFTVTLLVLAGLYYFPDIFILFWE